MLNQVQQGLSTGFKLVSIPAEERDIYRVSAETYAETAQEAQAIAAALRELTASWKRGA